MIRPYLARMTRSELFAVMVGGLASIAGSVMSSQIASDRTGTVDIEMFRAENHVMGSVWDDRQHNT